MLGISLHMLALLVYPLDSSLPHCTLSLDSPSVEHGFMKHLWRATDSLSIAEVCFFSYESALLFPIANVCIVVLRESKSRCQYAKIPKIQFG